MEPRFKIKKSHGEAPMEMAVSYDDTKIFYANGFQDGGPFFMEKVETMVTDLAKMMDVELDVEVGDVSS